MPVCVCPARSDIRYATTLADMRCLCVSGTLTYPQAHAHRISERAGHTRATYAHAGVAVFAGVAGAVDGSIHPQQAPVLASGGYAHIFFY